MRGGSWNNNARYCRCAYRDNRSPSNRDNRVGVRLCWNSNHARKSRFTDLGSVLSFDQISIQRWQCANQMKFRPEMVSRKSKAISAYFSPAPIMRIFAYSLLSKSCFQIPPLICLCSRRKGKGCSFPKERDCKCMKQKGHKATRWARYL